MLSKSAAFFFLFVTLFVSLILIIHRPLLKRKGGTTPALRSQDVLNGDEKSEHIPDLEDAVRIIMDWSECRYSIF